RAQYESKEIPGNAKVEAGSMAPDGDSPLMTALKGTKFSGFVDAGYEFGFNSLHASPTTNPGPADRLFDNRGHSFYLNSVQLNVERLADEKMIIGYHLELAAGHDVGIYNGGLFPATGGVLGDQVGLQEGWVQILAPVGSGLDIRIGKMATLVGYEVLESKDDFNYSRGLLFSFIQPFTHTGIRASYNVNEMISGTIGFSNGLNALDGYSDFDHGKQFEAQVAIKPTKDALVSATILVGNETNPGGVFGSFSSNDKYYVFDIVASFTMDKLTLGLNLDWSSIEGVLGAAPGARSPMSGFAVYAKYSWTDAMASALRLEYMSDGEGRIFTQQSGGATAVGTDTGSGSRLVEVTLTQEMKVAQQLILRVELRSDNSNNHNFVRDGKNARGDTTLGFEAIMPF
ncbi:MAG: porin, partial [Planctomycetaceae bacterium]|nr:porin [Planctomycetaceae bacterium]